MTKILLPFFILFAMAQHSTAQWSLDQGAGYYKLSAWYLQADEHYTDTGDIDPNATRGQFNVNLYAEYGLGHRFDVIAYIPFFARTYQNDIVSGTTGATITPGEEVNSIGDIDLAIRYGIVQKENWVLSGSLLFGLPSGESSGGSDGSYQTGDGEFNQMARMTLGVPFLIGKLPIYAKTYLGFNNRTQDFSDELRGGIEIGTQIINGLWIAGKSDSIQSLQNGSRNATNTAPGSVFANNVEFTSLGVEASYYLTDTFGVSANYTGALSGKIIYAAPSYSGGIFLDLK
ncbi:MAG: hypothetical protein WBG71_12410 [Leeuwenhoekiella sp.]